MDNDKLFICSFCLWVQSVCCFLCIHLVKALTFLQVTQKMLGCWDLLEGKSSSFQPREAAT